MSDDPRRQIPEIYQRINTGDRADLDRWAKALKVNRDELDRAVRRFGGNVREIRRFFGK